MGNYYKFGRRKLFITSAIEANAFSPHFLRPRDQIGLDLQRIKGVWFLRERGPETNAFVVNTAK